HHPSRPVAAGAHGASRDGLVLRQEGPKGRRRLGDRSGLLHGCARRSAPRRTRLSVAQSTRFPQRLWKTAGDADRGGTMTGAESVPILVVTTDEDLAETLSDGLRILGHVPLVAATTGEAFDRTRRQEIDVLLLDGRAAGRQALPRRIGEADLATETIVIAPPDDLTGALEAMRRGAHDFLLRPPKMDEFSVRVAKAVERARLRREILMLRRQ